MTYDQLSNFVCAANHMNLSRAARELYISPSALSKSISALEADLGAPLFVRTNNVLTLTPAGEYLKTQGEYILKLWEDTRKQVRLIENTAGGTVVFSIPNMFDTNHLFGVLSALGTENSSINFVFHSEDPLLIRQNVQQGTADIGITFSYLQEADDMLCWEPLFPEQFCLIVNASNPLAAQECVSMEQLRGECMIVPALQRNVKFDVGPLNRFSHIEFERQIEVPDTGEVFFQISVNKGVSILPRGVVHRQNDNVKQIPIAEVDDIFYTSLVWKQGMERPQVKETVQFILEHYPKEGSL